MIGEIGETGEMVEMVKIELIESEIEGLCLCPHNSMLLEDTRLNLLIQGSH